MDMYVLIKLYAFTCGTNALVTRVSILGTNAVYLWHECPVTRMSILGTNAVYLWHDCLDMYV